MTRIVYFILPLTTIVLVASPTPLLGQAKTNETTITTKPTKALVASPYLFFTSLGPALTPNQFQKYRQLMVAGSVAAQYRVSFLVSEIYIHVHVDLISVGEENTPRNIAASFDISGFDIGDTLGERGLISAEFKTWKAPNSFVVRVNDKTDVQISINTHQEVKIVKKGLKGSD